MILVSPWPSKIIAYTRREIDIAAGVAVAARHVYVDEGARSNAFSSHATLLVVGMQYGFYEKVPQQPAHLSLGRI